MEVRRGFVLTNSFYSEVVAMCLMKLLNKWDKITMYFTSPDSAAKPVTFLDSMDGMQAA